MPTANRLWLQTKRLKAWLPLSDQHWSKLALLKTLVQRDLDAKYKGSVLGNFWPLLQQVAQLLIYTYVFSVVLNVRLSSQGLPGGNSSFTFGLWLFAGLIPWIAFTSGLNTAARSVLQQQSLVTKVVFPLELIPLVPVLSAFVESTFGTTALIVFVALLTQTVHSTLWLLPAVWLPLLLLTSGLAYLMASLTVFLRDIPQGLAILLNLWFYATPILYPAELIPQPFQNLVFWLNPLAAIAATHRDIVLTGEMTHWSVWWVATAVSSSICFMGYWCYQKLRPAFADVL
ncbi:MAG: ABC transporter permease [Cyanobacteria bacterium P01_D01_bin.44]